MLRQTRIARSLVVTATCAALATSALLAASVPQALAETTPPANYTDPITIAAAYIGVPTSTLATDIMDETRRTGSLGIQAAIDQLDSAMATQLSTLAPITDLNTIMAYRTTLLDHHAIRDGCSTRPSPR